MTAQPLDAAPEVAPAPPLAPTPASYSCEFLVEMDGYHALIRGEGMSGAELLPWIRRQIDGLKSAGYKNVPRTQSVTVNTPPAPAPAPARTPAAPREPAPPRQPARPAQDRQGGYGQGGGYGGGGGYGQGGGRPQRQQRGGGGGGRQYTGEVFGECPDCGARVWDNRIKKADGWKGPFFACRDDCGFKIWKPDGSE